MLFGKRHVFNFPLTVINDIAWIKSQQTRLTSFPCKLFAIVSIACLFSTGSILISIDGKKTYFGLSDTIEIALPSQLSVMISCELLLSDTFPVNPWIRDSIDVPVETNPGSLQSQTIAFYEDVNDNTKTLYINNFNNTLSGNYTCYSAKNRNSIIVREGTWNRIVWMPFFFARSVLFDDFHVYACNHPSNDKFHNRFQKIMSLFSITKKFTCTTGK